MEPNNTPPSKESLEYQKGFEAGYKLRMYNNDLLTRIMDSFKKGDSYSDGLFEGIKEAEKELEKKKQQDKTDSNLKGIEEIRKNKSNGKEKDMGKDR